MSHTFMRRRYVKTTTLHTIKWSIKRQPTTTRETLPNKMSGTMTINQGSFLCIHLQNTPSLLVPTLSYLTISLISTFPLPRSVFYLRVKELSDEYPCRRSYPDSVWNFSNSSWKALPMLRDHTHVTLLG